MDRLISLARDELRLTLRLFFERGCLPLLASSLKSSVGANIEPPSPVSCMSKT